MEPFEMTTDELILCVNLLLKDAQEMSNLTRADGTVLPEFAERINDGRQLANRMKAEVQRREDTSLAG